MVSIFFDEGEESSEFLDRIGFDADNPELSDLLKTLSKNEELNIEYTLIDLKNVISLNPLILNSW